MTRMPALFLGHGSPMNAIEDNAFTRAWSQVARRIPRPRAIVCVSAHWETRGVGVTAMERPRTIHDFSGFPDELFAVRYPAPGSPALAARVAALAAEARAPVRVQLDTDWGLDHGAWSVLGAMYPQADVPVVQLSLDTSRPGAFHHALGRALAPLRDEGVLVLGSGNIVHNLRLYFSQRTDAPLEWAVRFDTEVRRRLQSGAHEGLIAWESLGPEAQLAIPTPEHYLPLLYVAALAAPGEPVEFFNTTVLGSLSMTCVLVGAG